MDINRPPNPDSVQTPEEEEITPEISIKDEQRILIKLSQRMGMGLEEWKEEYFRLFKDVCEERPELVSRFGKLAEGDQNEKEMLDKLIEAMDDKKRGYDKNLSKSL